MRSCLLANWEVTLHYDFRGCDIEMFQLLARLQGPARRAEQGRGVEWNICGVAVITHFPSLSLVSLQRQGRHWVASIVGFTAGRRMPLWVQCVFCGYQMELHVGSRGRVWIRRGWWWSCGRPCEAQLGRNLRPFLSAHVQIGVAAWSRVLMYACTERAPWCVSRSGCAA